MSKTATYLYCLVGGKQPPASRVKASRGLPGSGRPRLLPAGPSLWVVVADAPLARYGSAPIERGLKDLDWVSRCALAHEAVIERIPGPSDAVLPAKLFTLFDSDERVLAHVRKDRRRIDRAIARVTGRREWGVRLTFDEERLLEEARAELTADGGARSGAGFLTRKKNFRNASRTISSGAKEEADRLFEELAAVSADARARDTAESPIGGPRLVLDAAFLIDARRAKAFRAEVKRRTRKMARAGYALTLTGPWPPYNFVADPA